jgi:hypothetical protein
MKLFSDPTGPLVTFLDGILQIEDLNPSNKITWRMSRREMRRLGWRCIVASFSRIRDPFKEPPPSGGFGGLSGGTSGLGVNLAKSAGATRNPSTRAQG